MKTAKDVLTNLINNDSWLNKNKHELELTQHSFFNHCIIRFNNPRITEKYVSIFVDLQDDVLTITHKFVGDISKDPLKMDIWNRYMRIPYVAPKYAHEDSEVKCSFKIDDYRVIYLLMDLVKCLMYNRL